MLDHQYFGFNLAYFRGLRGYTQSELAQRAGKPFSQPFISMLERGLRPADGHVSILAQALAVPTEVLLRRPRVIRARELQPVIVDRAPAKGTIVGGQR